MVVADGAVGDAKPTTEPEPPTAPEPTTEPTPDPCSGKACGDTCIVQGDMAGMCDATGACSFDYGNLGCAPTKPEPTTEPTPEPSGSCPNKKSDEYCASK